MTTDIRSMIRAFADRLSPKVPATTVADVKDWVDHTELSLALEVLAEHLFDSGNTFDADEWAEFSHLVDVTQCDPDRFNFVKPTSSAPATAAHAAKGGSDE